MLKNLYICLAVLFFSVFPGQTYYSVAGIVSENHKNIPLSDAAVQIGKYQTTTDARGTFTFPQIASGSYTLTVSHPGCDTFQKKITVNSHSKLSITLEHSVRKLKVVIITRTPDVKSQLVVSTLSTAELARARTENLGNMLNRLSGVSALKTGNNIVKPVIHGMYGSRVAVFTDGVRLSEQEWGVEHAPSVNPQAFDKVSVIKGAGTLAYAGDVSGGVVILDKKNYSLKDTLMGTVSLNGISNGKGGSVQLNALQLRKDGWQIGTSASYKKLGDLSVPGTTLQNTGTQDQYLGLRAAKKGLHSGFSLDASILSQEFGIFKGAHIGNPEDFYYVLRSGNPLFTGDFSYKIQNPRQDVQHIQTKAEYYLNTHHAGKFSLNYAYQINYRKEYDVRIGAYNKLPGLDLRLQTHKVQLQNMLHTGNFQLHTGLEAGYQDNFADPATKRRRLIPDYRRYEAAGFAILHKPLGNAWSAEAGIRYDFSRIEAQKFYDAKEWALYEDIFPEFYVRSADTRVFAKPAFSYHNISANAGIRWQDDKNDFKINLSRTSRAPNPAELFADGLHHSAAIIERGKLTLEKETAYQANVLWERTGEVISFSLNPYMMWSGNYIMQIPNGTETSVRGVFPVWDYRQVKALMAGADVELELQVQKNWSLKTQLSGVYGQNLTENEPLLLMPPFRMKNSVEYTFPWKKLTLRLEHLYTAHQNRFPVRDISVDLIENNTLVRRVIDYSTPPPAYSLFNIWAGIQFGKHIGFQLSVENVANTEYRDYLNRLRFFSPEMGRNIIAGFQYSF